MAGKKKRTHPAVVIPSKLKKIYEDVHGTEFVRDLERASRPSNPKPVYLRVNTLKSTERDVLEAFNRNDIHVKRIMHMKNALRVVKGHKIVKEIPEYFAGLYYVQDFSSFLAVHVLDIEPQQRVLDACAAPGGKATHAAQEMNGTGIVYANEMSISRILQLRLVVDRLGAQNVVVFNQDATIFDFSRLGKFDRVLIDAPCSSDGVAWRRGFWKVVLMNYHNLEKIIERQHKMLENCWKCLKEGGFLVYATCSFSLEENERLITRFLHEHENVRLVDLSHLSFGQPAWTNHDNVDLELRKARSFTPMHDQTNGFFMAKMQKI